MQENHNNQIYGSTASLGVLFRRTRESQGVDIEQISEELFIKPKQLNALEKDLFNELPHYTFARSFAIKYAEYLGLDEEQIGNKFDEVYPESLMTSREKPLTTSMRSAGKIERDHERTLKLNFGLLIAFFAVVALVIFLLKTVSIAEEEHNQPKPIEEKVGNIEQQQGAVLEHTDNIGSTGSAVNLD